MDEVRTSGNSLITEGVISFVAGLFLLFLTGISQSVVVFLFAAYAVIYGISQYIASRGERDPNESSSTLRAIGIFSIVAGLILLFMPGVTLPLIILFIAAYAIVTGGAEILAAYAYRNEIKGDGWFAGAGAIRVLFGLFLLFNLGMSLPALILTIAIYAIVIGPVLVVFGYQVRSKPTGYHRGRPVTR